MLKSYLVRTNDIRNALCASAKTKEVRLLLVFLLLLGNVSFAQTYIISPTGNGGFESGTTLAANGWSYAGNASINVWQVGTAAVSSGSRGCFIGTSTTSNTGSNSAQTRNHIYRSVTIPAGSINVQLSFKRKQTTGESGYDYFGVFRTTTPPTSGTYPPSGATTILNTDVYPVSSFTTFGPYDLTSTAGTTFYLVFSYTNGDAYAGVGNPAIDEVSLSYVTPTPCTAPSAPTGLSFITSATGTTATFTPPSPTPTGYILVRSTGALVGAPTSGQSVTPGTAVGSNGTIVGQGTSSTLATSVALTANTNYTMTLFAYNNTACTGGPVFSTGVSGTITTCPNAPSAPTAGTPTGNTIPNVTWSAPSAGGGAYSSYTYLINVYTDAAMTVPATGYPIGGTTVTSPYTITGLNGGTQYWYTIKAVTPACNSAGSSGTSTTAVVPCSGTPPAGVTTTSASVVTGSATFNLGITGGSGETGLSYQWQSSACGDTWTNISSATGATLTTSATASAFYRRVTTCGASSGTASSVPVFVTRIGALACSTGLGSCSFDYISSFSLTGACGTSISSSGTSCTSGAYDNQTAVTPVKMYPGGSYSGNIGVSDANDRELIWIDFNNNGSFADAGEQVMASALVGSGAYTINIPSSAPYGVHLMRIRVNYNANPGLCTSQTYSHIRDYSIQIVPTPSVSSNSPICGTSGLVITALPNVTCGAIYNWTSASFGASVMNVNTVSPTVSGSFSVSVSINGATSCASAVTIASINPNPAAITGTANVCTGLTTALASTPSGGTWTSGTTAVGTVNATTGVVTGVTSGTTNVSYTLSTGCRATQVVTVNNSPAAISGTASVCAGSTTSLSSTPTGGTWESSSPGVATVTAGATTGGAAGLSLISYTLPNLCMVTRQVTVNPLPTVNVTPTATTICEGNSAGFSVTSPPLEFSLLSQNFNSGLGSWAITSPVNPGDGLSIWHLTSASAMGAAGDGTAMAEAAPAASVAGGLTQTYLTSPSFSTVGYSTVNLTFNEYLYANSSSDINIKVQYSIDGGSVWNTFINQMPVSSLDSFAGSGSWTAAEPEVTVALPAPALNVGNVKLRWFYETNWGGWWSIDNIAVKAVLPAPTYTWAGVSGASGLSCTGCATPTITPTATGANVYSVTGTSTCSAGNTVTVNVNPLPGTISGASATLCVGAEITLSNPDAGGSWSSANTSIADVNPTTGIVTGNAVGTAVISYTLPTSCARAVTVSVTPAPPAITGTFEVCEGASASLAHSVSGGVWSSSSTAASIDGSTGVVTGNDAANLTITYVLPSGCRTTTQFTVNELPSAIAGTAIVCENATTTLSSTPTGGTWGSNGTSIADFTSPGVLSGISQGTTTVTYTLSNGCNTTKVATVNAVPGDITGTFTVCEESTVSLSSLTSGGTWGSNAPGIADFTGATNELNGVSQGNAVVSYTLSNGCYKTATVTVNQTPSVITGPDEVCEEATVTLVSTPATGTWNSDNTSIAAFSSGFGVLSGESAGSTMVTYSLPNGCRRFASVTVNALPANIDGVSAVCEESTITLSNTIPGGIWGSDLPANADFATTAGVLSGYVAGNVIVSYTLSTGCYKTAPVTVHQTPALISGIKAVCEESTTSLSTTPAGGTWTSGSTVNAEVDAVTGVVSGMFQGVAPITYSLSTGCLRATNVTVNALPGSIGGTLEVCKGLTTNLTNSMPGGDWTSSNTAIADIDASGVALGETDGLAWITYTIPSTGCYKNAQIIVNPLPADITGDLEVCEGLTTSLDNTTPGGSWMAAPSLIATVNTSGVVSGYSAGSEVITYRLTTTGCQKTATVVVNPLPADIAGDLAVCEGLSTNLTNSTGGGTWSGGDILVATIDGSGVVSAVSAGTTTITYTLTSTGCRKTAGILVNPLPADIVGPDHVCVGSTVTMTDATPGGAWSSLSADGPVDAGGVVSGNNAGNTTIVYTLPTGCIKTADVIVDPLPEPITGTFTVCENATTSLASLTPGGSWSSSSILNASIDDDGVVTGIAAGNAPVTYMLPTGCIRSEDITVHALPANIDGIPQVCHGLTTTLDNTTTGGVWSTDAPTIADISTAGVVSGLDVGNANITYTLTTGCAKSVNVVVNALPDPITGTTEVCQGLATTLSNTAADGTWTSASAAIADVDMNSGVVNGVLAGTTDISYVLLSTGCMRTVSYTVKALPGDIAGTTQVCEGLTTALTNTTIDGTWSSDDILKASVDATGMVTGEAAGNANIIYTLLNGCSKSVNVLVNPVPDNIVGAPDVCEGSTTAWTNATADGMWSSSAITTANVDILSGVVSGVSSGTATITYALMTGCLKTADINVNALPTPIGGTLAVCQGQTTALTNGVTGGTWSASSSFATVDAGGVVTGTSAGVADITYTLSTGCSRTAGVLVNALPDVHNVTGGGSYCAGTGGVTIDADGSQSGVLYQLYNGTSTAGSPLPGTGAGFSFGSYTAAGTYTILATDALTGCTNDMAGSATVVILPLNIPSVTVASGSGTTVCAGTAVTYSATPVNGGTLPAYGWEVNGIAMASTGSTFSYVPLNGDVVKVTLTSNASCAIPAIATDALSMTVDVNQTPVATIAMPAGVTSVCRGSYITLTATSLYGGTAPIHAWYKNGFPTGSTGTTFMYIPDSGDVVTCKLTSNYTCVTTSLVTSNALTMDTDPVYIPVVSLNVSPGTSVGPGATVTFSAIYGTTAGPTPSFQWYKNGGAIPGATNATYVTSALVNNDSISCKVTGSSPCGYESFNSVLMRVKQTGIGQLAGGSDDILLIPNPNKGNFVIKGHFAAEADNEVSYEVTNMLGQTVYRGRTISTGGDLNERIQLGNDLANGMYILNLRAGDETRVFHFVLEQ